MKDLKKLTILMAIVSALALGAGTAFAILIPTVTLSRGILISQVPTRSMSLFPARMHLGKVFGMKEHMASGPIPITIIHFGLVSEIILTGTGNMMIVNGSTGLGTKFGVCQ